MFFDEITTGLDPAARRRPGSWSAGSAPPGVTVVLVSHLMDEVEELCDRVAILDRGRVVALDTPTALIDRSGSEQRMRFRPVGATPRPACSSTCRASARSSRRGSQVLTSPAPATSRPPSPPRSPASTSLVADLRLEQRTLDDAFVALTGRSLDREETG